MGKAKQVIVASNGGSRLGNSSRGRVRKQGSTANGACMGAPSLNHSATEIGIGRNVKLASGTIHSSARRQADATAYLALLSWMTSSLCLMREDSGPLDYDDDFCSESWFLC